MSFRRYRLLPSKTVVNTMARPREFDPNDVLQTAIELFWEKGYAASSVDEVVRRSGVAKYGVYGTFGSKREMFKKVLAQYGLDRRRDMHRPIRTPNAALPEVKRFFERAVELMTPKGDRRGCLMVNTGLELGARDGEIADLVNDFFSELNGVMEGCLSRAAQLGQLDATEDISALATYLTTEFRTALMLSGSGCSREQIQAHLDFALRVLH